jgi:hypothetical protein
LLRWPVVAPATQNAKTPPIPATARSSKMTKLKAGKINVEFEAAPQGTETTAGDGYVQVDREGNFVGAQVSGGVVEKVEGGVKVTRPDGAIVFLHDAGNITIENMIPKSVGVEDLFEIESFAMRTVDQLRIYRVEYFGGGYVEVTYSQEGQVIGLIGHNIKQSISKDNEILVRQGDSASGQVH